VAFFALAAVAVMAKMPTSAMTSAVKIEVLLTSLSSWWVPATGRRYQRHLRYNRSMRIFVAGASGAIGRPLVRRLVSAGHAVTGMTRRDDRAAALRELGADAVMCDALDARALEQAVVAARPEVVVHQLTALPAKLDPNRAGVYDATNRLRTEGTANLVAAAGSAGAGRMVAQSVAFIYAPVGEMVKDESDPTMTSAPGQFGAAVAAMLELERRVLEAEGMDGLVLRYGFFYGPGTAYSRDGSQADEARRRRLPIVGRGEGVFSFIQVEDAAEATVAACERGAPGIYNVCDDEPAPMREWVPAFAAAVGARPPLRVPKLIARMVAGPGAVAFATRMRGAANAKARRELGWAPGYSSWRRGFAEALG